MMNLQIDHIDQIDTSTAPEGRLRELHALNLEWDNEWSPDDPQVPWGQRLAEWRNTSKFVAIPRWLAISDGVLVGTAGLFYHHQQDLENVYGWVYVRETFRRMGIARQLVRPALEHAIGAGRVRYATPVKAGSPFSVWPERLGLKPAYNERVSQLRTAEVDRDMLSGWIERASERAAEYELMWLGSPIPDEHMARFLAITEVMNTAPMEDFDEDEFHWTEDELRDKAALEKAIGREILTLVAVHRPTGDFAGYTMLAYQSLHPEMAHQWDTGVDPSHQNRGLGRWLKAAMMERVLDDFPDVAVVETENAESNDPMLKINVAMGFRPALELVLHQGPTESALSYVR